jgi:glucan phosphoethanolaminetransferase (alkaline phosphatase superfamily)
MNIVGLLIVFIIIILLEAPRLWKQKMWRELAAFFFFLILGMVIAFLGAFNIKFTTPTTVVDRLFGPIMDAIFSLLQ